MSYFPKMRAIIYVLWLVVTREGQTGIDNAAGFLVARYEYIEVKSSKYL